MGCNQSASRGSRCFQQCSTRAGCNGAHRRKGNNDGIRATFGQLANWLRLGRVLDDNQPKASTALETRGDLSSSTGYESSARESNSSVVDQPSHATSILDYPLDAADFEFQGRLKCAIQALESPNLAEIVDDLLDTIATSSSQVKFHDILDLACDSYPNLNESSHRPLHDISCLENILKMRYEKQESNRARSSEQLNRFPRDAPASNQVHLFTSVQQLCSQVIKSLVLRSRGITRKTRCQSSEDHQNILCLFLFGRQGSSKGELVVELTEHSALSQALDDKEVKSNLDCPLYYHIDVAAMIVANLNERIHEYRRIQADIATAKNEEHLSTGALDDPPSLEDQEPVKFAQQERSESHCLEASLDDEFESGRSSSCSSSDEPGQLDLTSSSTKLRSTLQMKLMRFSNCVTSKWVFGLIRAEIDRIEVRVTRALRNRTRVYLINLIPNQLSLFKSCLYLKQSIALRELQYNHWAIFFERRTNIKLLKKERMGPTSSGSHQSSVLRLSNLVLPLSLPLGSSASKSGSRHAANDKLEAARQEVRFNKVTSSGDFKNKREELRALAAEVILNSLNEKIGPKIQDHFVQQFRLLSRLTEVRYNPTHDYNYASDFQQQAPSCSTSQDPSGLLLPQSRSLNRPCSAEPRSLIPSMTADTQEGALDMRSRLSSGELFTQTPALGASMLSATSLSDTDSFKQDDTTEAKSYPLIKWAVELELCSQSIIPQPVDTDKSQKRFPSILVFREPKSRSPLFKSQFHPVHYKLVAVKVAYETGNTNTLYEIKRVHHRVYKLKSQADLDGLMDLVAKAKRKLQHDCRSWLNDAMQAKLCETTSTLSTHGARRRASVVSPATRTSASDWIPASLIVYTIHVDVSRLNMDLPELKFDLGVKGSGALVPILTLNSNQEQVVDHSIPEHHRSKRRVQFRLAPAPVNTTGKQVSATGQDASSAEVSAGVQRRQWIDGSLFVSANCEQVTSSVMKLMPVLASIVQARSCE